MYTYQERCLMNLSDIYTLLYGYIADSLIQAFGVDGERAVREGTRRYGDDRARTLRRKHLEVNAKINMLNLFTLYPDLPGDPRFRRELQELNTQVRMSHTLVCPMADIWIRHGLKRIGRIYCEEFHKAFYGGYAFGKTQVNLAKTLTQDGDEYCAFNIVLRPETLPKELKSVCFEEYDPSYRIPESFPDRTESGRDGFCSLCIKIIYHLLTSAVEQLGEEAIQSVCRGMELTAEASVQLLCASARVAGDAITDAFVHDNFPLSLNTSNDAAWQGYEGCHSRELTEIHLLDILKTRVLPAVQRKEGNA